MFKKIIGSICAVALLAGGLTGLTPGAVAVEGEEQVVLKTWYTRPAENVAADDGWAHEPMPIGNGFIGGMVYGGVDADRIIVNEHSLWSGGPGSKDNPSSYKGGNEGNSNQIKQDLQELRQKLQDNMTEFTNTKSAKLDENGKVVSHDYGAPNQGGKDIYDPPEIAELVKKLVGGKDGFGSYQVLGRIEMADPTKAADPSLKSVKSSADPISGDEVAANLFDGNNGSKFFAGNGTPEDPVYPLTVEWEYNSPYTFKKYSLVSGNDEPNRDPAEWKLYGHDGNDWVEIDHQTSQGFDARNTAYSYEIEKPVTFSKFKLEVISTIGGPGKMTAFQLSEIILENTNTPLPTAYTDYIRSLDLRTAVANVSYTAEGVTYNREYFASNPGNVMVIRFTADKAGSITRRFSITSQHSIKTITANNGVITMTGQPSDQKAHGLKFAQQLKVIPTGGTMTTNGTDIDVFGADEVLVIMSAATNYQMCKDDTYDFFKDQDPLSEVMANIAAASAKSYEQLLNAHVADYSELFSRVELNLNDVKMPEDKPTDQLLQGYKTNTNTAEESRYLEMLYYQFNRYLLIACSREGGLPANLQGIWADGLNPPWAADYHTNINLQMNYWLAQQTNLAECHTPVIDYIHTLVPRGTESAKFFYCKPDGGEVRGWTIGHENNVWGHTAPGNYYWGFYFPAAAAWMCQDIWEYYAFTQDEAFLEENFDVMLQAALFWVDNLWTDTRDGTLVANPSYSPEHGPYSLGASADQTIIWELFEEVRKAAEVLGKNMPELDEIATAQSKLHMPKIGLAGQYMEWKDEVTMDITGDGGHRHVNHLYALHPGTYVVAGRSAEDNKAVEAMKVTLNTRGDGGTGWSKAWKINFWARLRDGNRAGVMVNQILKESTYPNLFDTHAPFQIDGNFGATAGMTEMLLQSQGDSIDLLPALPAIWAKGSVKGLKARGNFEVSMEWNKRILQSAEILSNVGNDCVLSYDGLDKAKIVRKSDGKEVTVTKLANGKISFPTQKGETYLITDVPQDRKFPDARSFMGITFNNLYNQDLLDTTGAPDSNGTYVETAPATSAAAKLGLQKYDVVRKFNGTPVIDAESLETMWNNVEAEAPITLTVLRKDKEFTVHLSKSVNNAFLSVPCRIVASGYDAKTGSPVLEDGEVHKVLSAKAGDAVGYTNFLFPTNPSNIVFSASATAATKITVRYAAADGPVIAEANITATNGQFKTFTAKVEGDGIIGLKGDLYLTFSGPVKLEWFMLETPASGLGDVNGDGKVNTTDARLTLQRAVDKIGNDKLNMSVADVNGDGKVNTTDARLILQYAVNKIDQFPA